MMNENENKELTKCRTPEPLRAQASNEALGFSLFEKHFYIRGNWVSHMR